jgi:hypothetical protein
MRTRAPSTPRDAAAKSAAVVAGTTAAILTFLALFVWSTLPVWQAIVIALVIGNVSTAAAAVRSFLRGDDDPLPGGER